MYNLVFEYINSIEDDRIVLLRNIEVIMWLFNVLTFLPPIESTTKTADELKLKALEDAWGQQILKTRRPDLKLDKQWTNRFGEYICEELFILQGKNAFKPVKKEHYQPDIEIDNAIVEAKTQTYYTNGTAGEKILGCPFKYADIPSLYNKPLIIVCVGGAENVCRESYGNLPGIKCTPQKQKYVEFFKENNIEYIGATDILQSFINNGIISSNS